MKKDSPISRLFKSNRSIFVDAAIEAMFLENLKVNENDAFNLYLNNVYKNRTWTKKLKYDYVKCLKIIWKNNKDSLTKEVYQKKKEKQKKKKNPIF